MSRRDVTKNPISSRYNVPRPGENRPGNDFTLNKDSCFFRGYI